MVTALLAVGASLLLPTGSANELLPFIQQVHCCLTWLYPPTAKSLSSPLSLKKVQSYSKVREAMPVCKETGGREDGWREATERRENSQNLGRGLFGVGEQGKSLVGNGPKCLLEGHTARMHFLGGKAFL